GFFNSWRLALPCPNISRVSPLPDHSLRQRRDATSPMPGKPTNTSAHAPDAAYGVFSPKKQPILLNPPKSDDEISKHLIIRNVLIGPARFCKLVFQNPEVRCILRFDAD